MGLFDWLKNKLLGPSSKADVVGGGERDDEESSFESTIENAAGQPVKSAKKIRSKFALDASKFAPLTGSQIKQATAGLGSLWRNPWFGRRDLIPPANDVRTQLIDRGMVGAGLITPEELVKIHEVGLQMDELRPDLLHADLIADEAVKEDKEARERRKAEKKAVAAAQKRKHAEEVAHRKATDIDFLGRGVSGGLADRRSNIEKLQQQQLPVMASPGDVAGMMGISIPRLRWLAYHSESSSVTHYVRFQVPKKSGGMRELAAPHHDLAATQHWILVNILEKIPVSLDAHGFIPGRSTMTNAVPHVGQKVVINMDLKDFFPSITFPRVKGIFQSMGYSPAVSTILSLLCTECPRRKVDYAGRSLYVAVGPRSLPQGACTSPALSNLLARRLDARIGGLAKKLQFVYTRYADDLTFSGDDSAAPMTGYLLTRVRHIIEEEHFAPNENKTRVQRPGMRQTVTGIVVNRRPNVPRRTVRRIRAILHQARKQGLEAANRSGRENFEHWLGGMIAYIRMVNPYRGEKLKKELESL